MQRYCLLSRHVVDVLIVAVWSDVLSWIHDDRQLCEISRRFEMPAFILHRLDIDSKAVRLLNVYVFQSCTMEPRHSHSPACLRRSLMHVSSGVWERFVRISHLQRVTNTEVLRRTNQTQLSAVLCDMFPGQMRGWTIREHCAQLIQGYRATGDVLLADPDSHGR